MGSEKILVDKMEKVWYNTFCCRGVAQFGRALRSGRRGRGFKSRHLDQNKIAVTLGFMRGCGGFLFSKAGPKKNESKRIKTQKGSTKVVHQRRRKSKSILKLFLFTLELSSQMQHF